MNGNIEYWVCYECEQVWQDEALTQLTNHKNVVIAAEHTNLVHMDAVAPGCHMDGNVEYWVCYDCGSVWTDEALTQVSNIKSVILPATGGEVVHFEAVAPNCHMNGNIEYWVCYECEQVWQDEALTQLTNIKNVVLPATGGEVIHVEAKAPTCTENGNIEHWYCETCEQVWQDEALTQLTNHKNVIVAATGHTYVDGVCHCGAKDELPPTGDVIAIFCALVAASSMGLAILPKKKEN
jgi:ribosomal protein L37AE/L43A